MSECSICYGKYNKTKNAKVACFGCDYESCRECLSRYLLDPNTTTANCPFCHKEWSREFLLKSFTQKFVNTDIKHHREEVLFQRERALLPTRQAEAERRKQLVNLTDQIRQIEIQIAELGQQRSMIQGEIYNTRYGTPAAPVRREFIQPCPNEDCRGFLSTQWKCGLCDKWSCKSCHEVKGPRQDTEHTCDPDKVASAKLIAEETKPCPKCGVRLFKISGCNQMWCTSCNDCAFDWVTGKIESTIHNPHYFEYQRRLNGGQVPRQEADIPCGLEIDHFTSREINRILFTYNDGVGGLPPQIAYNVKLLDEICRMHVHILHALIPRYRIDPLRYNEEYGIIFIMGQITEEDFKVKLQRADKKFQMSHEIMNVLQMCAQTLRDIIGRYKESLEINEPGRLSPRMLVKQGIKIGPLLEMLVSRFAILQEVFPLFEYANECFVKIAGVYGSKSPVALKIEV